MKKIYDTPPRLSRRYLRDQKWISDHIQELIEKYPNQWILVYNQKVIANSQDIAPVWDKADELELDQPYLSFIERDVYVY